MKTKTETKPLCKEQFAHTLTVLTHQGFSTRKTGCSSHNPPGCTLQSP